MQIANLFVAESILLEPVGAHLVEMARVFLIVVIMVQEFWGFEKRCTKFIYERKMSKKQHQKPEGLTKELIVNLAQERYWSRKQLFNSKTHQLKTHIRDLIEARQILTESVRLAASEGIKLWLSKDERRCLTAIRIGEAYEERMLYESTTDQGCISVSEGWIRFTGAPLSEQLGDGWLRFVHPQDLEWVKRISRANATERHNSPQIFRVRRADGVYRWIQDITGPETNPRKGFCIDIDQEIRFMLAGVAEEDYPARVSALGLMSGAGVF